MTGFGTVDTAVEAMKLGAVDFVQKPFFRDELLMRVRSRRRSGGSSRARSTCCSGRTSPTPRSTALVGESTAMARVKDLIHRAADAPGTVLITGETGTGKELAARAIHAGSAARRQGFRRRQLRGADGVAARGRTVRPCEGRVHGRRQRARRA